MSAPRTIVHVDMDAFFASVEQRDRPELRGQPVLVGRIHRGVVATCSYEARKFGIHSAMPMAQATRRCPRAIVVAPRFAAYQEASAQVFAIFRRYTPLVEALSIDEAFLDVTGSLALYGSGEAIARAILGAIASEVRLPASAGVAPSKFVAKLASDWHKPCGLSVVPAADVAARLAPLPVEQLLGVGARAAAALKLHGLSTFADVRRVPEGVLASMVGGAAKTLKQLAWGEDERAVIAEHEAKSIGAEATLDRDETGLEALRSHLWQHVLRVASRLAGAGRYATEVHLKLKAADFRLITRQCQLQPGSALPDDLFAAAWRLLDKGGLPKGGVRLIGVSAAGLRPGQPPTGLFAQMEQGKQREAEGARLAIERRFGRGSVTRAATLETRES